MADRASRAAQLRKALRILVPLVPHGDAQSILGHAGRRRMDELAAADAIHLATIAHVRHRWTDYDALLESGYDKETARALVATEIDETMTRWGGGDPLAMRNSAGEDGGEAY